MRNMLATHRVFYLPDWFVAKHNLVTNEVRLDVFLELIEFDKENEIKVALHLKDSMFDLGNFGKMNVGAAKKTLSKATKAAIVYMVEKENKPKEWLATAEFCGMIGHWADLVSCKHRGLAFSLQSRDQNLHNFQFLKEFIDFIGQVKMSPRQKALKPSQRGAILTSMSIMWLADNLLSEVEHPVSFFRAGNTLSDPIESLHGQIRAFNKCPTAAQYSRYLKVISITQTLKTLPGKGTNASYEPTNFLTQFKNIRKLEQEKQDMVIDSHYFIDATYEEKDFTESAIIASIASYILRQTIMSQSSCETCKKVLVADPRVEDEQEINCLIKLKEYKKGIFCRPTVVGNLLFQAAEALFMANRDYYRHRENIVPEISERICELLPDKVQDLPTCHLGVIVRRFIKLRCFKWAEFMHDESQKVNAPWVEAESFCSKSMRQTTAIK